MSQGVPAPLGAATGGRAAYSALLRDKSYRSLLWAALTSGFGDWIGLFAIIALTENLEGATRAGALSVAFVMAARVLPTLGLGPIAGVLVDRWDRKRTMVVTDIVRGVVMIGVAFVGDAFQLIVATFVVEVASTLFIPAKDAIVPNIVPKERLVQANQLALIATYGTLPLGALLFAVTVGVTEANVTTGLLAERPVVVPILINAATFILSSFYIRGIRLRPELAEPRERVPAEQRKGALQELREGFAFIVSKPLIRALVGGVMAAFVAAGFVISLGKFFVTIVNAGDAGFGVLAFAVGVGLIVGLISAGPLAGRIAKERLFAPGIGIAGLGLVVTALMPALGYALVPAAVMGAGSGLAFVTGYTLLQEHSEDSVRGRTFAAFNTGVRLALFASLFVGPLLIVGLGVERTEAQLEAGEEITTDELDELGAEQAAEPDSAEARYPYQVGGIRITLMIGGLLSMGGAVLTGRAVRRVLPRRDGRGPVAALTSGADGAGPEPGAARGGVLVVFEGGEGAGKSTQIRLLRAAVERLDREVVLTREPGGTDLAERVRELLLDPRSRVDPRAEALLYAAARSSHVEDVLRPAVERGAVVLCDRYIDSSIVYQGVARGLGEDVVADLNRWATAGLVPDLVVLLDVEPAAGLARAGDTPDRLEAEGLAFHRSVNAAYLRLATAEPNRYLVLDAGRPVEELHAAVRERVQALLLEANADAVAEPLSAEEYEEHAAELGDADVPALRDDPVGDDEDRP